MKVLGINFSNDAAASIVVDGVVVGAVAEERLSRIKHDAGFPRRAVQWCLEEAGLTLRDLDAVGFFWNPGIHAEPGNARLTSVPRDHLEYLYSVPVHLMRHFDGSGVERVDQTFWLDDGHPLRMHYLTHHDCHAAGAFYRSNFPSAAILTVDGYGERTSTHIGRAKGDQIDTLATTEYPHSVGSLYAAFTQYLGFRANNGEGKVMGLASYGEPEHYDAIRSLVNLTDDGFELDLSYFSFYLQRRRRFGSKLVELLGPERVPESDLDDRHKSIACSLQRVTEDIVLHLAKRARALSDESRLCMSGGVALNCVANTRIRQEAGFSDVYFMPASSDAGTSLGAALYVSHVLGDDPPVEHPQHDYLGPHFSEEQIASTLSVSGCAFERPFDLAGAVADHLAAGRIVGWFQGRAEFGPRALGARSILADPRPAAMKDTLNARVKFREWFRPFAPAVLAERVGELFEGGRPSPYMLEVMATRPDRVDAVAAGTHVDGGARVQTVSRDTNAPYYDVISAFADRTGVPSVINTSFNIRGEPIVHSVADALKCYFTTDMDALAIGPYLLEKVPSERQAVSISALEEEDGVEPSLLGAAPERASEMFAGHDTLTSIEVLERGEDREGD
jgi:carbamoyltransferase